MTPIIVTSGMFILLIVGAVVAYKLSRLSNSVQPVVAVHKVDFIGKTYPEARRFARSIGFGIIDEKMITAKNDLYSARRVIVRLNDNGRVVGMRIG